MPALLAALIAALSLAAPGCELHIWPAGGTGATSSGWLSNLGIAGAAVDYERHKDSNLRDQAALIEALPPAVQARLLADAGLPAALGLGEAKVVIASRSLAPESAKAHERPSNPERRCHAELVVSRNVYANSPLHGRTLTTHFTWTDFRKGRPRLVRAKIRGKLSAFPSEDPKEAEAARRDVQNAFAANVQGLVRKLIAKR
jgi:hypothetical protein